MSDAPATVTLWHGRFARLRGAPSACAALDAAERERAARFHRDADRERWTIGRLALRRVLGERLGREPGGLVLDTGPHGKPYLAGGPAFNLSHSGEDLVIAVAETTPLGVDVEPLRTLPDWRALATIICTEGELATLERLDPGARPHALLALWTRKEALLKGVGVGIARHLRDVEMSAEPDCADALLSSRLAAASPALWRVLAVGLGPEAPDALCALAVRTRGPLRLCRRPLEAS